MINDCFAYRHAHTHTPPKRKSGVYPSCFFFIRVVKGTTQVLNIGPRPNPYSFVTCGYP